MLKLKWAYLLDVAEHLDAAVVLEHTLGDGRGCHTTDRLTRRRPASLFGVASFSSQGLEELRTDSGGARGVSRDVSRMYVPARLDGHTKKEWRGVSPATPLDCPHAVLGIVRGIGVRWAVRHRVGVIVLCTQISVIGDSVHESVNPADHSKKHWVIDQSDNHSINEANENHSNSHIMKRWSQPSGHPRQKAG